MSRVEKFRGRTPAVALRKARAALGDDAKLLSARRLPGGPADVPAYEVRVAPAATSRENEIELGELKREVTTLRKKLAEIAVAQPTDPLEETDPMLAGWLDALRRRGVGRATAEGLVRMASRSGTTAAAPERSLDRVLAAELGAGASRERLGQRSTLFVGPTGSGKTTALARLAADLVRRGSRPLLVTTDGESLAGEDNLATVAAALGLELRTAFLEGQLGELVATLPEDTLVLVDTPGCAVGEPEELARLRRTLRSLPGADVLLVIPAAIDREEARALVEAYRVLGECRLILTKLDELCRPGRIVDLARAVTRPIAWVTFGRGVQGTCSQPDDPEVVTRILGPGHTLTTSA